MHRSRACGRGSAATLVVCFLAVTTCLAYLLSTRPVDAGPLLFEETRTEKRQLSKNMDDQLYRAHIDMANMAYRDFEDILDSPDLDSCQMCQQGMGLAKRLSLQAPEMVPGVLRVLCAKYSFKRLDACAGRFSRLRGKR